MSCKTWMLSALVVLSCTGVGHAGDAKTYRWVDAKGRVHYSDVPVPSAEQIQVKPGSGVVGVPREQAENAEQRRVNCERRREQLRNYEMAGSITESDALGNVKTYTEAERNLLLDRTRAQVEEACAGQPG